MAIVTSTRVVQSHHRRYRSTSQSIPNNTNTTVDFDTLVVSVGDIGYSAGTWTVNTSGIYLIAAGLAYAGNATGVRGTLIVVGGVNVGQNVIPNAGAGDVPIPAVAMVYQFTAGTTFTIQAFQNSGGALNCGGSLANGFAAVTRLS